MSEFIMLNSRPPAMKGEPPMLLIQNAHLIDPASRTDGIRDILIEGEKIIKIAEHIAPGEAAPALTVLNAEGLTAIPGLVDAHVHFRDPGFTWKEDIDSGARAAAAGGVTTVVLMANTKPCVDNADTLRYVLEKGEKTPIHVATCANVTLGMKGKELVDMKALHAAGAAGFTDDGIPLLSEETARAAMEAAAEEGVPISFHEENPAFIQNNGINAGKASAHFGIAFACRSESSNAAVRRSVASFLSADSLMILMTSSILASARTSPSTICARSSVRARSNFVRRTMTSFWWSR